MKRAQDPDLSATQMQLLWVGNNILMIKCARLGSIPTGVRFPGVLLTCRAGLDCDVDSGPIDMIAKENDGRARAIFTNLMQKAQPYHRRVQKCDA
jgi:hypothetical protein